jgi:hypothetical protein
MSFADFSAHHLATAFRSFLPYRLQAMELKTFQIADYPTSFLMWK